MCERSGPLVPKSASPCMRGSSLNKHMLSLLMERPRGLVPFLPRISRRTAAAAPCRASRVSAHCKAPQDRHRSAKLQKILVYTVLVVLLVLLGAAAAVLLSLWMTARGNPSPGNQRARHQSTLPKSRRGEKSGGRVAAILSLHVLRASAA